MVREICVVMLSKISLRLSGPFKIPMTFVSRSLLNHFYGNFGNTGVTLIWLLHVFKLLSYIDDFQYLLNLSNSSMNYMVDIFRENINNFID